MRKAIISLVFAVAAFAQNTDVVKVRFGRAFCVAQSCLPAGDYSIRSVEGGSDMPLLSFQSDHNEAILVPVTRAASADRQTNDRTEVLMRAEGGKMTITKISLAGRNYSYDVVHSQHAAN